MRPYPARMQGVLSKILQKKIEGKPLQRLRLGWLRLLDVQFFFAKAKKRPAANQDGGLVQKWTWAKFASPLSKSALEACIGLLQKRHPNLWFLGLWVVTDSEILAKVPDRWWPAWKHKRQQKMAIFPMLCLLSDFVESVEAICARERCEKGLRARLPGASLSKLAVFRLTLCISLQIDLSCPSRRRKLPAKKHKVPVAKTYNLTSCATHTSATTTSIGGKAYKLQTISLLKAP